MKIGLLFLLSVISLMTGCAANGPAFESVENPDVSQGLLYFYRPSSLFGVGLSTKISIDEVEQGSLKEKGYFSCCVKPGKRIIEAKIGMEKPLTLYLDVESGQEYYIRWWFESSYSSYSYNIAVIPIEYAIQEIQHTRKSK
jgi:hypothetical protein